MAMGSPNEEEPSMTEDEYMARLHRLHLGPPGGPKREGSPLKNPNFPEFWRRTSKNRIIKAKYNQIKSSTYSNSPSDAGGILLPSKFQYMPQFTTSLTPPSSPPSLRKPVDQETPRRLLNLSPIQEESPTSSSYDKRNSLTSKQPGRPLKWKSRIKCSSAVVKPEVCFGRSKLKLPPIPEDEIENDTTDDSLNSPSSSLQNLSISTNPPPLPSTASHYSIPTSAPNTKCSTQALMMETDAIVDDLANKVQGIYIINQEVEIMYNMMYT